VTRAGAGARVGRVIGTRRYSGTAARTSSRRSSTIVRAVGRGYGQRTRVPLPAGRTPAMRVCVSGRREPGSRDAAVAGGAHMPTSRKRRKSQRVSHYAHRNDMPLRCCAPAVVHAQITGPSPSRSQGSPRSRLSREPDWRCGCRIRSFACAPATIIPATKRACHFRARHATLEERVVTRVSLPATTIEWDMVDADA